MSTVLHQVPAPHLPTRRGHHAKPRPHAKVNAHLNRVGGGRGGGGDGDGSGGGGGVGVGVGAGVIGRLVH